MKLLVLCFLSVIVGLSAASVSPVEVVGECPEQDGKYPKLLPDSEDKSIFYMCSHGRPIKISCPANMQFDPEENTCIRIGNFSPIGECPPKNGDHPTFLPDSEDKTIYYECNDGIPYKMVCPPGLVFDPNLNVCVWP